MRELANKYLLTGIIILTLIGILTFIISILWGIDLISYDIIGFCFQLVCIIAYWLSWKKISVSSPKNLPLLYMVSSGLRLILAAFVVLIYMFVYRKTENLLAFSMVFTVYYIIILIYDTYYFMSAEKKKLR